MDIFSTLLSMQAEISLAVVLVVLLLASLLIREPNHRPLQLVACSLLLIQLILNVVPSEGEAFGGMYHSTALTSVVKTLLTGGTLLVFLQSGGWLADKHTHTRAGEFYFLTLSTLLGMYFMVSAGSFILFYVGLELASIPMACLVAFNKYRRHSAEAGAKFILSSMFSSSLMLYGLSMVYGTCGTVYFSELSEALTGTPLQVLAMVFFFSGLGFKLSLVPFHMWTPDVYQGGPTSVSAYLSVISKGAAAFALCSILVKVFSGMIAHWSLMLSVVIVITITVGNVFAILQTDMKRFMAYSSISQAGYIVLAALSGSDQGTASLVYYVAVYVVANLAVFGVIGAVERQTGGVVERNAYAGLYTTNPHLSFVMTLALFSLAGIPPFAGFFSKFFVFASAFQAGHWAVVFIALVNTIISLYYYLLVVKAMYITPSENPVPYFRSSSAVRASLWICMLCVIGLGIFSSVYTFISHLAGI